MNNSLKGKIALVTGGTKGIGKAIAEKLIREGAQVIVTARNKPEHITGYHFIAADLAQPESAEIIAQEILDRYGRIDIIVNNAGANTGPRGGYAVLSDEDWQEIWQLNLMSAVRINKALLPSMTAQQSGVIIHISSGAAVLPIWDVTMPYSAAKAALNAYSKSLAHEVAAQGLRVLSVLPGMVKTPLMQEYLEGLAASMKISPEEALKVLTAKAGNLPLGRMAEPEEIANMVVFLASPEASYVTGANVLMEGGLIPTV